MKTIQHLSFFLARLFLSAIFILAPISKLLAWNETESSLMNALCEWQSRAGIMQPLQDCLTFLVPWGSLLLAMGALCEMFGGLMLLIGYKEKLAALLLIIFLIPTTLLFHSFWFLEGAARDLQQIMFLKNGAILGGLILVALQGAKIKEESNSLGLS